MKTTKEQRYDLRSYAPYYLDSFSGDLLRGILDDLEAAEAEVQRLREQTQWRPIENCDLDYASTEQVLLSTTSGTATGWWFKHFGCWSDGRREIINPTHYMLLPQPPQAQESERE